MAWRRGAGRCHVLPLPGQALGVGGRGGAAQDGPAAECRGLLPWELTLINMVLAVHSDLSESKPHAGWGLGTAGGKVAKMNGRVIKLTITHLSSGPCPPPYVPATQDVGSGPFAGRPALPTRLRSPCERAGQAGASPRPRGPQHKALLCWSGSICQTLRPPHLSRKSGGAALPEPAPVGGDRKMSAAMPLREGEDRALELCW